MVADTHPFLAEALPVIDAALAPIARRLPLHVSRDDLASAGKVALVAALQRFRGDATEARAYGYVRARGAMLDELRRLDPLSRRARARARARAAAAPDPNAPAPSATTVTVGTGQFDFAVIFDAETDPGSVRDDETPRPDAAADAGDTASAVRVALTKLAPNHAYILRRYYFDDATLEEIAGEIGVSKERVRQLREVAAGKLRTQCIELGLAGQPAG